MALTDNAVNGRSVKEAYGKGKLTLTADCEVGDLLTKAGALADGNSGANKADWVALDKALSGVEIEVAKIAVIGGLTGATLGDLAYLSDTAGGYSATAGTKEQVVGQALSATDILVQPQWTVMTGDASSVAQVRFVDVQLTNANLLALLGTDIVLVAAPGAGKAIVVHGIYMYFDVTTTAYTIGTATLQINYASDGADIAQITEAGFLDTATDAGRWYLLGGAIATPVITVPVANVGVVMRALTADMTGGNAANTLSVRTFYSVVDTAAFS